MKYKLIIIICLGLFAFSVQAQVVSSIKYKGNKKTKIKVLEKLTSLEIGKSLDSIVLRNDVTLLSRLPVCNRAIYKVNKNKEGNFDVEYTIEETNTIIPTVNFWTASNQQFSYQLGLKEFNFLGENRQLGAFYRNNGFHSFSINYKDPFLFSATTGVSLTVQSLTSLEPLFFDNGSANYEYTNSSIETTFIKRLSSAHKVELGINLFQEKYKYVDGFQSSEIPSSLKENKVLFKSGYDYNKLVYNYQYVNGFRSVFNAQYVMPIQKDQRSFYIFWNDFFYYKKIHTKGNFATRLRLGLASNDDSPFSPFALDNNLNIRGVGNIIDRGTGVVVLNAEYRHTILDKNWFSIQTNVFVDGGSWRRAGGELKEIIKGSNARLHPGVGLRFIHKKIYNAVLRVDYGRSIINGGKEKGLVFGIGQYF